MGYERTYDHIDKLETIAGTGHNRCVGLAKHSKLMRGRRYTDYGADPAPEHLTKVTYIPQEYREVKKSLKKQQLAEIREQLYDDVERLPRGPTTKKMKQNAARILRDVCEAHGVTLEDFMGIRKLRSLVQARMEFSYIMNKKHGWSYSKIGQFVQRDHTTILHQIRRYEDDRKA